MNVGLIPIPAPTEIRPADVAPFVELYLSELPEREDIDGLWNDAGKFGAISAYLKRSRQHNADVVWADLNIRRRIGELLGPPEDTNGRPIPRAEKVVSVQRRYECRRLYDYWPIIAELRPGSIRAALREIERRTREPAEGDPVIREGDFRTELADVADDSVSLILTDPPYAETALPLYDDLAEFAQRKLVPGGSLLCYVGQTTLPEAIDRFRDGSLRYWWTLALLNASGSQMLPGKWVMTGWKPVLWFVRERRGSDSYVRDVIKGSRAEKDLHDWAQGKSEVKYLIEQLTLPGDLVVDPFAGSGIFLEAAAELGRAAIGASLPGKVATDGDN